MIPIVDCSNNIESKAEDIFRAIENSGFVYLINYGLDYDQVEAVFELGKQLWSLNVDQKSKFAKQSSSIGGYVGQGVEKLDTKSQHQEFREAFNFRLEDETCVSVDKVVPKFYENLASFYGACHQVSQTILSIFGQHLNLKDPDFFTKCHPIRGTATTLRLLHYPPLPPSVDFGEQDISQATRLQYVTSEATRCGEHSDYGSLTLLFQDMIGGLEVMDKNGEFVQAKPVEKSVLVNTGDLLQRWTSDRIKAVKHRVRLPENRDQWSVERYSMAYFMHPTDDCVVECLDGSKIYQPVTAGQYLLHKYAQTY